MRAGSPERKASKIGRIGHDDTPFVSSQSSRSSFASSRVSLRDATKLIQHNLVISLNVDHSHFNVSYHSLDFLWLHFEEQFEELCKLFF